MSMLSVKKVLKQSKNILNKQKKTDSAFSLPIDIIPDESFQDFMDRKAVPFLSSIVKTGYINREKSGRLYYEAYRPACADRAVVISHGFSESAEKYKEVIYYFTKAGYQVYLAEHRGHGRSLRETSHPNMIHVNRFSDYVRDLHIFIKKVVKPASGGLPLYLFAHSMGGAIGAFYLEAYPNTFKKAILTAPMLSINLGTLPSPFARAFGRIMIRRGRGGVYAPGQHPYDGSRDRFENSCSACLERFLYYHKKKKSTPLYQTCGSSYSWAYQSLNACQSITRKKNCRKITAPVLVFYSFNDRMVRAKGIYLFVKNTPSAQLIGIAGSRHEIYNSSAWALEAYYRKIFEFLKS